MKVRRKSDWGEGAVWARRRQRRGKGLVWEETQAEDGGTGRTGRTQI
jgi:hypothetical protein